jgi:hypothetical protein
MLTDQEFELFKKEYWGNISLYWQRPCLGCESNGTFQSYAGSINKVNYMLFYYWHLSFIILLEYSKEKYILSVWSLKNLKTHWGTNLILDLTYNVFAEEQR